MKVKIFIIIAGICFSTAGHAQSLYSIKYQYTTIDDNTIYNVFLVREEDGSGFYRVSFYDPETKSKIIVELDMQEQLFKDKDGNEDSTKIFFKGSNPRIIAGDKNYHYYPERFWFKLDEVTSFYEPWGVTSPDEAGTAQGKFVGTPELLDQEDLTETYISQFFLKDEEIYQALFATKERSLTPEQKRTTLHLIIVANTEDDKIGNTCMLDKNRTMKMYKDLAGFMGISFNPKEIYGDTYSKENVQKAVMDLYPASQDIVVFYYSGHGFSDAGAGRKFPNMALSGKSYEEAKANGWNVEDVFNIIKRKGARLNLVISDCCNNSLDDNPIITCDIPKTRSSELGWSLENCKTLFMNATPTSILITAAQKGEMSSGNGIVGGYFTNEFRSNLITYFKPLHHYPTWIGVLGEVKTSTIEKADNARCSKSGEELKTYKQHPVYVVQ